MKPYKIIIGEGGGANKNSVQITHNHKYPDKDVVISFLSKLVKKSQELHGIGFSLDKVGNSNSCIVFRGENLSENMMMAKILIKIVTYENILKSYRPNKNK